MSDATWYYNPDSKQIGCWVQCPADSSGLRTRKVFCVIDNYTSKEYAMNRVCDKPRAGVPNGFEPIENINFGVELFNESRFPATHVTISRGIFKGK